MKPPPERNTIWVFRMVHHENLPYILEHGMYCSRSSKADSAYKSIGSSEVIGRRDNVIVKCDPDSVVNDYVPFYFGYRTPMLYMIHTGFGIPRQPQEDIIYLCCRFVELVESKLTWCFTDGNAATAITTFHNDDQAYKLLDWESIHARDWRDDNKDGDHDRARKKHAEFLVKSHVPPSFIRAIVVKSEVRKAMVEKWLTATALTVRVYSDQPQFYF